MLFTEISTVNSENHMELINTTSVKKVEMFRMLRMEVRARMVGTVLETVN
jgi:hypothetical protein